MLRVQFGLQLASYGHVHEGLRIWSELRRRRQGTSPDLFTRAFNPRVVGCGWAPLVGPNAGFRPRAGEDLVDGLSGSLA